MHRIALALLVAATALLGASCTVYEDGSYVLPDGRAGCLPHGLCND